jgi:hypothetical protein
MNHIYGTLLAAEDTISVPGLNGMPLTSVSDGYEDDFDILSMVDAAYDKDTRTLRDLKIDDRDLPMARNYYDYCSSFTGKDAKMPFARQMWMGYKLLAEYCPRCSNPKWEDIDNVPVDFSPKDIPEHVQFLDHGVCPRCKSTKSQMIKKGQLKLYQELDACLGQRAGKSAFTASLSSYITHVYLKVPKLSSLCDGIQESTPLTGTFVGISFNDALKLLWTPYTEIIDNSPWFQQYHELLMFYSEKYGREFLKKRDIYIRYVHKNLDLFPSSSNKRSLRGRTRIFGAIDELGWFPINEKIKRGQEVDSEGDRERADADEVYMSLDRSLLTVRSEVLELIVKKGYNTIPTGMNFLISSPSSAKDKICRLVDANRDSDSALALQMPTWEINPRYSRNHPVLVEAYKSDPIKAERDYGAIPPKTANPFIENPAVEACFKGMNRASVITAEKAIQGKTYRAAKIKQMIPPTELPPAIMSLDAGFSNNAFALTIQARIDLVATVPVVLEVQPRKGASIHYEALYKGVISPLIETFNVRMLFADRWQSIAILHRAQSDFPQLVVADMYSVKRADFDLVKSMLEAGTINLPKREAEIPDNVAVSSYPNAFAGKPAAHLHFQLFTVKESGRQVIKGDGYTDDLWRAMVLGVSRLFDPKLKEQMDKLASQKRKSGVVGVAAYGTGGTFRPRGAPTTTLHTLGRLGRIGSR